MVNSTRKLVKCIKIGNILWTMVGHKLEKSIIKSLHASLIIVFLDGWGSFSIFSNNIFEKIMFALIFWFCFITGKWSISGRAFLLSLNTCFEFSSCRTTMEQNLKLVRIGEVVQHIMSLILYNRDANWKSIVECQCKSFGSSYPFTVSSQILYWRLSVIEFYNPSYCPLICVYFAPVRERLVGSFLHLFLVQYTERIYSLPSVLCRLGRH